MRRYQVSNTTCIIESMKLTGDTEIFKLHAYDVRCKHIGQFKVCHELASAS
jgi:hypothetical protein